MKVLKWNVPVDDQWHPIGSGQVVHVDSQDGPSVVQVWTMESEHSVWRTRAARAYGTGQPLPAKVEHLGSVNIRMGNGNLTWHLFAGEIK